MTAPPSSESGPPPSGNGPPPSGAGEEPSGKVRTGAKLALGFALAAVFLWLAFRRIPLGEILRTLADIRLLPVLLAIILQFGAHFARAWRWKLILSSSQPGLRRRRTFAALMVGYAVNTFIPRGGELARALFLRKIAGIPLSAGVSSVLGERLLDLAALAAFLPFTLLPYQESLERIFPGLGRAATLAALAAVAGLVLLWLLARRPDRSVDRIRALLGRLLPSWKERGGAMAETFLLGLGGLFRRKNAWGMIALSAVIWLLYILSNWVLFSAISFNSSFSVGFWDAMALTFVVAVAFTLPSPGGTGTTHFFASQMLLGLFPVLPAEALAYATLVHANALVPTLILGGGFAALMRPAKETPA
ncbi:MAG: lysylphosphatidylglycerol synthase transmembrane domain-containing protein [bacterium]